VSERKQVRLEKDSDSSQQQKGGGQEKTQDEVRYPTGADQGFVYYEE
jgi:hypothetical protein